MIMDVTTKSCLATHECIQGSINYGVSREVLTSDCCNSSLCNNKTPEPPKTKPNGKKCFRCDGNGNCSGILNCDGDEDMCIKVSVGKTQIKKGCATKSMCLPSKGKIPVISCCEGDLCNDAKGVSGSLLVLAIMLILIHFLSA
uniref:UPAR/Ly6 domain-containing protein n=1 Tax=Periophthalmus magnuspinnatus TaxID=409849 RepID=A0A3B4BKM4_9GOBI